MTKRGGNLPKYNYRDPEGMDYRKAVIEHWADGNRRLLAALLKHHGAAPVDQGQKAWTVYWLSRMSGLKISQPRYDSATDRWS